MTDNTNQHQSDLSELELPVVQSIIEKFLERTDQVILLPPETSQEQPIAGVVFFIMEEELWQDHYRNHHYMLIQHFFSGRVIKVIIIIKQHHYFISFVDVNTGDAINVPDAPVNQAIRDFVMGTHAHEPLLLMIGFRSDPGFKFHPLTLQMPALVITGYEVHIR